MRMPRWMAAQARRAPLCKETMSERMLSHVRSLTASGAGVGSVAVVAVMIVGQGGGCVVLACGCPSLAGGGAISGLCGANGDMYLIRSCDLSMTMTAAVPRPDFSSTSASKSINTSSQMCLGSTGTEAPPGITPSRLSHAVWMHIAYFDNDVDPFSNHHESDTHLPGWSEGNEATVEENGAAAGRLSDDHRDALTGSAS